MGSLIDFTLNKDYKALDTSRNVKPEKPKGYLVKTPWYKEPVVYCKDLATDTYGIVKGVKGKANDHELGKQNDIAMKAGAVAIAGYLMAFRPSKVSKLMEVVGVGSFFTSLALWPKLAIALPLKLRTGVDIQQKYVDSYGRKKNFYQDSQYLPWDLYSKEEIKEMGDKMGVPYDVPNRDEVIREKARKLSVQGNTLWMATAGFATPIMTALICSGLKPAVETAKQKADLKRTQRNIEHMSLTDNPDAAPKTARKRFEDFITANRGKKLESSQEIASIMDWYHRETNIRKDLIADLDNLLSGANNDISKEYVERVYAEFCEPLTKAGVSKEDIIKYFENHSLFGAQNEFMTNYTRAAKDSSADTLSEATAEILKHLIEQKNAPNSLELKVLIDSNRIDNVVSVFNRRVLDEQTSQKLRNVFETLSNFYSRKQVLDEWTQVRAAANTESMTSYSSQRLTRRILSALGFSSKEIDKLAMEGSQTKTILENKMRELAKNPDDYKKAVARIADEIANFDSVISPEVIKQHETYVDSICTPAQNALRALGFDGLASRIGGRPFERDAQGRILNMTEAMSGTVRNYEKTMFKLNTLGIKADAYRFIQTLDLFRRIETGRFVSDFDIIKSEIQFRPPRYSTVAEAAQNFLLSGNAGNQAVKLGLADKNQIDTYKTTMRLLFGAMPEEYAKKSIVDLTIGASKEARTAVVNAFVKQDSSIADVAKAALDNGIPVEKVYKYLLGMSEDTIEVLCTSGNKKGINMTRNIWTYMQTYIDRVINHCAKGYEGYDLSAYNVRGVMEGLPGRLSDGLREKLVGSSAVDLVRRGSKELSNTHKWLRMFGVAGAVIFTGTVLSTLFFGHLPLKEMYMRNGNKK